MKSVRVDDMTEEYNNYNVVFAICYNYRYFTLMVYTNTLTHSAYDRLYRRNVSVTRVWFFTIWTHRDVQIIRRKICLQTLNLIGLWGTFILYLEHHKILNESRVFLKRTHNVWWYCNRRSISSGQFYIHNNYNNSFYIYR